MLSLQNKQEVVSILDSVLGQGTSIGGNEQAHSCPFCHHHKKKLQVNLNTQQYHCWVCNIGGRTIGSLLRKLNCESSKIDRINKIYGTVSTYVSDNEDTSFKLRLPEEFKRLDKKELSIDPEFDSIRSYLSRRGIGIELIIKYNIGYCPVGEYGGRIIIPSYDKNNQLNYFTGRSYTDSLLKYKNPRISKNIIGFENQIHWNYPLTLSEGVFDAIAIRRNAIPLFGKFIPPILMETIFKKKVKHINIMLDSDAQNEANKYVNYFNKNGITVSNIIPTKKDPSETGFVGVNQIIKSAKPTQWNDIIIHKLKGI
jgi:DNA primase